MQTRDAPREAFEISRMLRTTLLGRCPSCQQGTVYAGLFATREACDHCRALYERNAGNWTGPVVIGYAVGCVVAIVTGLVLVLRFGFEPWVQLAIIAAAVAASVIALRPAKAWWIWLLWASGLVFPDDPVAPPD